MMVPLMIKDNAVMCDGDDDYNVCKRDENNVYNNHNNYDDRYNNYYRAILIHRL